MSRNPAITPQPLDASPAAEEIKVFQELELYPVMEIAEKVKCSHDTVTRMMKKHGAKAFRFGSMKFLGRDINRVLEAVRQAG